MSVVIGGTSGPSLAGSLEPVAFTGSMSAKRPYRNSAGDHLSQNLHHAQGQHRLWVASVGESPDADMCPAEPRRVCRRLQLLSKVEHHEQDNEQVFP